MDTDANGSSLLRLFQLASPMLPIGAFGYSQGLEWAVESGAVTSEDAARAWILGLVHHSLARLDVPVLARLHRAWSRNDIDGLISWSRFVHACRESSELRAESRQTGSACAKLLVDLGIGEARDWIDVPYTNPLALFALAGAHWHLGAKELANAYVWSWAENQAASAMKLIPLGQTAGQRILSEATRVIADAVDNGLALTDDEIGSSAPGLALASALHETQYSRLFRS